MSTGAKPTLVHQVLGLNVCQKETKFWGFVKIHLGLFAAIPFGA
jgi:hypothetical protein